MTLPKGSRLIMPLRRLDAPVAMPSGTPSPAPPSPATAPVLQRKLDLDAHGVGPIGVWHSAVQASDEACLLLDRDARVVAASEAVGAVLGTTAGSAVGARFVDLVTAVDFTSGAAPDLELERSVPPLRALATGGLARGLLRLRSSAGLVTYDVVAVPLSGQSGALAFFLAV
jgi:PAS domain-containing protein